MPCLGRTVTRSLLMYEPTYHTHPDKDRRRRHACQRERENVVDETVLRLVNFQHDAFFLSERKKSLPMSPFSMNADAARL